MADEQDKSQQTEEPTGKRLEQAREAGDVVKSSEVSSFILLAAVALIMLSVTPFLHPHRQQP